MKTIKIDCYIVYESYDRDRTVIGYAQTVTAATAMCLDKDGNNSPYRGYSKYDMVYNIIESIDEIPKLEKEKLISSALAKLTTKEKEALGLLDLPKSENINCSIYAPGTR